MKSQKGFSAIELLVVVLVIAGAVGWVSNIVKLIGTGFVIAQWGGMEVARIIGISLAPLGAVLGFF